MELTLRTEYWDDPKAREAFKKFMVEIHGLDFSDWESAGYWDNAYTPFSFFKGNVVVASVCIYLLDVVIDGRSTRLAQISGVGTLPEFRLKGLSRELTDIGLRWAEGKHDGVFLFAAADAVPYYRKCGFTPIHEYMRVVDVTPVPRLEGAVKLDPGNRDDLERMHCYARERSPVSDRFSVMNDKLVMFHVLYSLRDHIYEIPDLNCMILYEREGDCLRVFDIIGKNMPSLKDFYPYITDETDKSIEFHFPADKLGLTESTLTPLFGDHPFVKGPFPVDKPVFPFTCRA